jgi:hypothetical protein
MTIVRGMPVDNASADSVLHDLYAQAEATRKQSLLLVGQFRATERKAMENWQLIQASWDQTEQIRARRLATHANPEWLQHSGYARLQARLASMPVIEQAKGIIMARHGCSEDQAFDVLRRASQRENIKIRELAAAIVARAARSAPAPRQARPASTTSQPGGERRRRVGSGGSGDRYRASA